MSWPLAPPAFGGYCNRPGCSLEGRVSRRAKGAVSSSHPSAPALAYRCFLHQRKRHLRSFYYVCSILDGYSRSIGIESSCNERGRNTQKQNQRIISDNGPEFIARDFKEFIRIAGMTHVRTSPNYPQSNGKLERWHKSLKSEWHSTWHTARYARRPTSRIHAPRDRKLEEARPQRQLRWPVASLLRHSSNTITMTSPGETESGSAGMQPC